MNATFGNAIVGALARLLRPFGLGPLAGADPELDLDLGRTHPHALSDGFGLWHRHVLPSKPWEHPPLWIDAHPGQDPDRQ